MNNKKTNRSQSCPYEPCDPGIYQTGSTQPQKIRRGVVAVLLVIVIILCGVISILGVMNIHLFRKLQSEPTTTEPFRFSNTTPRAQSDSTLPQENSGQLAATETMPPAPDNTIQMATTPATTPLNPDSQLQGTVLSLQEIYTKTINSVVSISCSYRGGTATGTGVILSDDGYIVTNCHVVENAAQIQVLLHDGRTQEAFLVGTDAVTDLAVLQITADGLVPATLGDASSLRVGDTVVAIGDPLGIELRGTMTNGIISAINRDIDVGGRRMSLIQTNAALNTGNSGGPLINTFGQVIGINTLKIGGNMSSSSVEGLGFAIPSTTVQTIVNQLIQQGFVSGRPDLGITGEIISSFYQFYYRIPQGLYITEVAPDSSADLVGLEAGDILISLDGTPITTMEALQTLLYDYEPGDSITAIIYRDGKQYSVTLTVGEATS